MLKPGRNDPCACGSGKKYKRCCAQGSTAHSRAGHVPTPPAPHPPAVSGRGHSPAPADLRRLFDGLAAGRGGQVEWEAWREAACRLLIEHPDSGMVWKALGVCLWKLGKDALPALRKTAELLPNDAEAHGNLGLALRAAGCAEAAAASHRRAIAIKPDYADAHNNLGNALRDLGRPDEAAASYRRALDIRPNFAMAHTNLGLALRSLGRLDEAAACYLRALEIKPDVAPVWAHLGDVLMDSRRPDEAAAKYERALQLQPDLVDAHHGLGNALLDRGEFDAAAACYRRRLALQPDSAQAHVDLGIALRQQGRMADAEVCCDRALALDPAAIAAILFRAQVHADKGRFAEAEAAFRRAIEIEPESPEAWAGLAGLRRMNSGDAEWLRAAQRIAATRLPPRREISLRHAMGKYFDDVGDFEQAFGNFRRANELMKLSGEKYDRRFVSEAVDLIIRRFDGPWLERQGSAGNDSSRPVFIVGMPRSGTTLAEQILAAHSGVYGAGELAFWRGASATHSATDLDMTGTLGILAADYLRLLEDLSADAPRVVDKMPANFTCLGLIHAALPAARIIHMRRNPLDTCLSIYFQPFQAAHSYASDLENLAHYYTEYLRVMEHWRRTLPEHAILDVPYEGLIEQQEDWSRRMFDFLGLAWQPGCLNFQQSTRIITTFSKWQARQRINSRSVGRWRNYEPFIGPLLRLAGS